MLIVKFFSLQCFQLVVFIYLFVTSPMLWLSVAKKRCIYKSSAINEWQIEVFSSQRRKNFENRIRIDKGFV